MARIEWVKNRLENWALWAAREQGGGLGFASQSVLLREDSGNAEHKARVPIDEVEASVTDQAVSSLLATHRDFHATLVAHYIQSRSAIGVAEQLGVGVATVYARLASADRLLAAWFSARSNRKAGVVALPQEPTRTGNMRRSPKMSFTS